MNLVTLRDVGVAYDGYEALQHVDLEIAKNDFLGVIGPNGGGKTTLAKLIMGLAAPTGGQILLDGEDITGLSITDRARRGISYSFQQPPRFKGMKVSDLLTIAAGKPLSHDEACSYLTQVGLCARDYLSRDVDTSLSGGEVKRIEIATLLARHSALMIFDEPEAALSPSRQMYMLCRIKQLVESGSQFIVSTHSPIVMAYPGADIYEIADNGLQLTELEQTPHYLLMKRFCLDHEGMLRQLGFGIPAS